MPQIHQKNAGIDVFRDTGAYQPQAERLGREGSFGLSGGIVQRSGQKAALERNVPKLPDVQIDEDVAVQVDDLFLREQGGDEDAKKRASGKDLLAPGQRRVADSHDGLGDILESNLLGIDIGDSLQLVPVFVGQGPVVQDMHAYGASRFLEDGGHDHPGMSGVGPRWIINPKDHVDDVVFGRPPVHEFPSFMSTSFQRGLPDTFGPHAVFIHSHFDSKSPFNLQSDSAHRIAVQVPARETQRRRSWRRRESIFL